MVDQAKPFKVLAAIDADLLDMKGESSLTSSTVLRRALDAANRAEKSELHLVTVLEGSVRHDGSPPKVASELYKLATDEVAMFTKTHAPLAIGRVVTHVLSGAPASEIVWLAAKLGADLVVVGSHGRRGLSRLLVGSVAELVVRRAGCPVLVERGKRHEAAWTTPEIEPPCPQCLEARAASGGKELWCARHLEHHIRGHVYTDSADAALAPVGPWGFEA